jgi:putative DNA primase/helicase
MKTNGSGSIYQDELGALRSMAVPQREAQFECLGDVEAKPVSWLWPQRIPRKFNLFTGPPDCGKTLTAIDVMARVTRELPWPDGSGNAPFGSVIVLTAEDGIADTIRPRADVAGADVQCVHVLTAVKGADGRPTAFTFQDDLEILSNKVARLGDVGLIIVDPITAYLGASRIDSHRMTDMRAILSPLKDFAEERNVAVIGLTHPPKTVTRAMNAASGSLAFVAAARSAWLFTREMTDGKKTGRTLMTSVKNNLAPRQTGLAFRIETRISEAGIIAPVIVWDKEPVEMSADEALAAATGQAAKGENRKALAEAKEFLEDELKTSQAGRVEASIIEKQAQKAGISKATLKRARSELKVVSKRDGFGEKGKFYLSWPEHEAHRGSNFHRGSRSDDEPL